VNLPAPWAGPLADLILVVHLLLAAWVVAMLPLILLGGWRGWHWVRHRGLRLAHVAAIVVIAGQAWLGALCPLTVWEQALRRRAGQADYDGAFIEYWLSRLLYVEAPWWAFVAAYSLFAAMVVLAWRWVPPRRAG
jgi:hypothetical protein